MFPSSQRCHEFARNVFQDCDFNDRRLTRRVVHSIARLSDRPDAPVSTVFSRRAERVAFGRLLHNPRVVPGVLHEAMARDAFAHALGRPYAVAAHDTVFYTLADHVQGTGAVSARKPAQGVLVHNAILCGPEGDFFGVVAWDDWTRTPRRRRAPGWQRSRESARPSRVMARYARRRATWRRRLQRSENWKWVTSLDAVMAVAAAQEGAPPVRHVFDREGDDWRVFQHALRRGYSVIVRARTDRGVQAPEHKLWALMAAQEIAATKEMTVQATPKRAARQATVAISFAPVTLRWSAHHGLRQRTTLQVWAVWVRELSAPRKVEPLEWMLLCTFPVETVEQALEVRDNYTSRWSIEPFHQVTKSGLHAETRWVDDVEGFERLLALILPAAVWLLRLQHAARATPKEAAKQVLTKSELGALKGLARYHGIATPWRLWTVERAVLVLALVGGYCPPRASPPGWKVLWRGWGRFRDFYAGWSERKYHKFED